MEAVQKFRNPQPIEAPDWGVGLMLVSSIVNFVVSEMLFRVGKKAQSIALEADGWHLRTDVYTSLGVMTGLLLIWIIGTIYPTVNVHWLDPVAAIFVALLIIKAAYELTQKAAKVHEVDRIRTLLKTHPDQETVLLHDQILDKKVVDMEDREVEVVYDIRLVLLDDKFYATEVDISTYGLLCRLGLRWLAQIIYRQGKLRKQSIPWAYIQPLPKDLGRFRGHVKLTVLKENLGDLPAVDLADILETLDNEQRVAIFSQLEPEHASDTLEQIDPNIQRELVSSLKKDNVARLVDEMTPAQAADMLSALPHAEAQTILPLLNAERAAKIKAILEAQEQQIINFGTNSFLKVSPETTIAEALSEYRRVANDIEVVWYLYVADAENKLLGVIGLPELIASRAGSNWSNRLIEAIPDAGIRSRLIS